MPIGIKSRRLLLLLVLLSPALKALPLWELEGTRNTIHVLGSVHFLREEDYPLPDSVDEAYDSADWLVMELDMDDLNPIQAQAVLMKMAIDPKGRDLEALIGEPSFESARSQAADIDIDLEAMRPFEPWFAALQISQLRLAQLGMDPDQGIESHLQRRAGRDGKTIIGLETLEDQLLAMDSLSAKAQRKFLMVTLEEAAEIDDAMDDILAAWRRGDVARLERELLGGLKDQPEIYAKLLVERNRNWTTQLLELADDERDYLVVVGALHLVGDDSVLEMLERRGIGSRQITR